MIHSGTCENAGVVVEVIEPVESHDGGAETSTSEVDIPVSTLTDGNHVVELHERAGDDPGAPVACAEITRTDAYTNDMGDDDTTEMY